MKNANFHVEILKAQGVSPTLASHIVGVVGELERENARLREVLKEVSEVLTEIGWHADRGLLMRVNNVLLPNAKAEPRA